MKCRSSFFHCAYCVFHASTLPERRKKVVTISLQPTKAKKGKKERMKIIFQNNLMGFTPILAQTTGSLSSGASSALGIVMLIGFIFGTICVVGGGFAIRRGDADTGKLSIIGGLIIAGAPVIVKALFVAFGIGSSTVDVGNFQ
jgi:hypothetical protein